MKRETFQLQDTALYVGPQPGNRHHEDPGYVDLPIGSSGKVRGLERGCVYVDWGSGNEGWQPRSYLMTFREFERAGEPGWS